MQSHVPFECETGPDHALPLGEAGESQRRRLAAMALNNALLAREKANLARELHDDLGQVLTALKLNISLFALQHGDDAILVEKANGMLALNERCMQTLCGLINRLRHTPDTNKGFDAAVESMCKDFQKRYNLPCVPTIQIDNEWLDEMQADTLLGVIREALNNIVRHASASEASVIMEDRDKDGLRLRIQDNGCGFDPGTAANQNRLGLRLMRESAFALGGRLDIVSRKNEGSVVTLNIPNKN